MHPLLTSPMRKLRRLARRGGDALTRLSDEADEIWEPFLLDEPIVATAARRREA